MHPLLRKVNIMTTDTNLSLIYGYLQYLMRSKQFRLIGKIINNLDLKNLSLEEMICYIRFSAGAKHEYRLQWNTLLGEINNELCDRNYSIEEREKILIGLERVSNNG